MISIMKRKRYIFSFGDLDTNDEVIKEIDEIVLRILKIFDSN